MGSSQQPPAEPHAPMLHSSVQPARPPPSQHVPGSTQLRALVSSQGYVMQPAPVTSQGHVIQPAPVSSQGHVMQPPPTLTNGVPRPRMPAAAQTTRPQLPNQPRHNLPPPQQVPTQNAEQPRHSRPPPQQVPAQDTDSPWLAVPKPMTRLRGADMTRLRGSGDACSAYAPYARIGVPIVSVRRALALNEPQQRQGPLRMPSKCYDVRLRCVSTCIL